MDRSLQDLSAGLLLSLMKKYSALVFLIFASLSLDAAVTVLFHPGGQTLENIADQFSKAQSSIDIAMYNMDATGDGPIVAWLNSEDVKARIAKRELSIRILLNGSPADATRASKMEALELSGADVRWISSSRELHHKFAVIDSSGLHPRVISGSANWSEYSRREYTENVYFIENEFALAHQFQNQFNFLWSMSEEFGTTGLNQNMAQSCVKLNESLRGFFNVNDESEVFSKSRVQLTEEDYQLTQTFVKAIDQAKTEVRMAATRFRLRPLYDAIERAANRGVKVQILVTQAEYSPKFKRSKFKMPECENVYAKSCSVNTNYAVPISRLSNVEVRIKRFSHRWEDAIKKQMHSKYLIIDSDLVVSGSFNLSIASEFSNFENVVRFSAPEYASVIESFENNFASIWEDGREEYKSYLTKMNDTLEAEQPLRCGFVPMSLTYEEVDAFETLSAKYKFKLNADCVD